MRGSVRMGIREYLTKQRYAIILGIITFILGILFQPFILHIDNIISNYFFPNTTAPFLVISEFNLNSSLPSISIENFGNSTATYLNIEIDSSVPITGFSTGGNIQFQPPNGWTGGTTISFVAQDIVPTEVGTITFSVAAPSQIGIIVSSDSKYKIQQGITGLGPLINASTGKPVNST